MDYDYELNYDLDEALRRQNLTMSDLIALKKSNISGVPTSITVKQLAFFLNISEGNVEEAKKILSRYYEIKQASPDLFDNRDPLSEQIEDCLRNQFYFQLPPTPDGKLIIYHALADSSIFNYHITSTVKTFFMLLDSCLHENGPHNGVICLFDMKLVGLGHLTRARISVLKQFFQYVQEAMPINITAIHIFNTVWFFDKLVSIAKPFMNAEILHIMHLHNGSLDYDEFSVKYGIPKSSLPANYGGYLDSVENLHEQYKTVFAAKRNYFIAEEAQRRNCDFT